VITKLTAADRGQGLNHAICDASNFVAAIDKVVAQKFSLKDTISAYTMEVVRRGGNEVLISKQNALMMHDWDQLMESPIVKQSLEKLDLNAS